MRKAQEDYKPNLNLSSIQPNFIMTYGLPGSGKSTWAKNFIKEHPEYVRINNDDIRKMLFNSDYSISNESVVKQARRALVESAISHKRSIILDNTNLKPILIANGKKFAESMGYVFHIADFNVVPLEECIDRDMERNIGMVGESVIRRLFNAYMYPKAVCKHCGQKASSGKMYAINEPIKGKCPVCMQESMLYDVINFANPKF